MLDQTVCHLNVIPQLKISKTICAPKGLRNHIIIVSFFGLHKKWLLSQIRMKETITESSCLLSSKCFRIRKAKRALGLLDGCYSTGNRIYTGTLIVPYSRTRGKAAMARGFMLKWHQE
ncbi:hypothetical protein BUALT_Bualt08G0068200 [Buddleja alternifolia]|uniref:Ribosomal protein S14 n=1 Tax=Buddleja alternifolia TaxID=168488 RepID=A0AAV6XAV6_9LAMI|nr:hypothetical protein BUALT_Bualt08G0068200 [Buddleja alternifolia]